MTPFGFGVDWDGDIALVDADSVAEDVLQPARDEWPGWAPLAPDSLICEGFSYGPDGAYPLLIVQGLYVAWDPTPESAATCRLNIVLTEKNLLGAVQIGAQVRWYDGELSDGPILEGQPLAFSWPLTEIGSLEVTVVKGLRRAMDNDELLVLGRGNGGQNSALRLTSVSLVGNPPFEKGKSWTLAFARALASAVSGARGSDEGWEVERSRGYEQYSIAFGALYEPGPV